MQSAPHHTRLNQLVLLISIVLLSVGSLVLGAPDAEQAAAQFVPVRGYTLEIDGQSHELKIDVPTQLQINGQAHKVVLKHKPYSDFLYNGVQFQIPQAMLCTVDNTDPSYIQWTLESDNAVLTLSCFYEAMPPKFLNASMVNAVGESYAGNKVERSAVQLATESGQSYIGTRLTVLIAGVTIVQDFYAFNHADKSYSLILQDTLADDGTHSADYAEMIGQFKKSLRLVD